MLKVIFYGTPQFAVPTLEALIKNPEVQVCLVVTQPDRPAGRGKGLTASPIKNIANLHQIPILQPENIRHHETNFLSKLAEIVDQIDLAVVIAFGQIIPKRILDLPKHGSVNLHASLLPRWRGAAPIQRAIEAGDKRTGICLMKMAAGLDTGPVYSQIETDIEETETAGQLHDRLSLLAAEILIRDLQRIVTGALLPIEQNSAEVCYAHKISELDEQIDWTKSASAVVNKIRALSPYPGAYSKLNGKKIKILNANGNKNFSNQRIGSAQPGQIIYSDKRTLEIACGEGSLQVLSIQPEGKRAMSISEFLAGYNMQLGDYLA